MPSAEQSNEWCEPVDDKAYAEEQGLAEEAA